MARKRHYEWIVPGYNTNVTVPAVGQVNVTWVNQVLAFTAYGADELIIERIKGHVSPEPETANTISGNVIDILHWRVRSGLENLQLGTTDDAGPIEDPTVAEEHFLDERVLSVTARLDNMANTWWPYWSKIDIKSKRNLRIGQTLMWTCRSTRTVSTSLRLFVRILASFPT